MQIESIKRIEETMSSYNRLIDVISKYQDQDHICRLNKKQIATYYGQSYTGTYKKISFLLRYGIIVIRKGGYFLTGKEINEALPFTLLPRIIKLVLEKPEIYHSYVLQAKCLYEPLEEVQTAWGFYSYFFGSKYPTEDEFITL